MSARVITPGQNLSRIGSDNVDQSSDYTAVFWWYQLDNHNNAVTIYIGNDPNAFYTSYVLVYLSGTFPNIRINFDVGLNGVVVGNINETEYRSNQWWKIAYVREGSDQRFYFNDVLIGTISADLSTSIEPMEYLYLFDDGLGDATADQQATYFREWNKAKTLAEIETEWASPQVVDTVDLWSDIPLLTDGDDISGANRNFTVSGATFNAAFKVFQFDQIPYDEDIPIPGDEFPYDEIVRAFTGVDEMEGYLSAFAGVDVPGDVTEPHMEAYHLTSNEVDFTDEVGNMQAFYFQIITGRQYYYRIFPFATTTPTQEILFRVRPYTDTLPEDVDNVFMITDVAGGDPETTTTGFINPTNGDIYKLMSGIPRSENGISFRTSPFTVLISGKQNPEVGSFYFYTNEMVLITTDSTTLAGAGQDRPPVTISDNYFYGARKLNSDNLIHLHRWDAEGNVDGTSWEIPLPSGWFVISFMAVSPDDTVLYYTNNTSAGNTVERWDLVNDVALSAIHTVGDATDFLKNVLCLSNGRILVQQGDLVNEEYHVFYYEADGTLIDTFLMDPFYKFLDHIASPSPDTTSFWAWHHKPIPGDEGHFQFFFVEIALADGSTLNAIEVADFQNDIGIIIAVGETPEDYFGINESCPFVILHDGDIPPPPVTARGGIYKIIPWSAKPEDTLWVEPGSEDTFDVKIPDPTWKTGQFGD